MVRRPHPATVLESHLVITFTDVVKRYGGTGRPALDGVSFRVEPGEFAFVVGASGSGKSTLMRLLLAEEKVSSGSLSALGYDVVGLRRRMVPRLRRGIGVVFQDYRLLPDRDVQANVAYVLHVLGRNPDDVERLVPRTLEMVGLEDLARRRPSELSGGEQQRVALARALVKQPALLLADEPTGNLDPAAAAQILALLEDINAAGTTILMATHNDRVVDTAGRRVIALEQGQVVRDEASGTYYGGNAGGPARAQTELDVGPGGPVRDVEGPTSRGSVTGGPPPTRTPLRTRFRGRRKAGEA